MRRRRGQQGFGLIAALFLLVVMAAAGVAMVSLSGAEHRSTVTALQAIRAYHAARSGVQWAIHEALNAGSCPGPTTLTLTEGGLVGFTVDVSCASTAHREGAALPANVYTIVSIAEYGSFGDADYVRRRLQATITEAP